MKRVSVCTGILVLLINSPAMADTYTWNEYGGHSYALTQTFGSWTDMENEAIAAGGHLVAIGDQAENDWVFNTFQDADTNGTARMWIGLYQQPAGSEPAGGWDYWSNGEPVTYLNWYTPTEPNDHNGEDYAHMYMPGSGREGFWNDWKHEEQLFPGVIELDTVVPEPSIPVMLFTGAAGLLVYALRKRR